MTEPDVVTSWETIHTEGVDILTFLARPQAATDSRTLIVIHENPGITEWRQEESARMAADLGWNVVVMNTYSRIGGQPPRGPFETPDDRRRAAFLAMPDAQVASDLEATIDWATDQDFSGGRRPAVLGFCSGGGQGIYAVATRSGLATCLVVIYGNIILRGELTEDRQPLDRLPLVKDIDCPVQMHVGELDSEIPLDQVDRFEAEMSRAGNAVEVYRYPDGDHVFADPTHPNYNADATAQVWPRVYRFLDEHTTG